MKNKRSSENGFTLIELLVVTAVMGVLAIVSATIISNVLRSQNKTNVTNEVRQNGDLVISKFERDVKQAESVEFLPPPPGLSVTLSAVPAAISSGQQVTLTWSSTSATSVTISPGVGTVGTSGSIQVSPTSSVTYTAVANGLGGTSAPASASVTVDGVPPPTTMTASNFIRLNMLDGDEVDWFCIGSGFSRDPDGSEPLPATVVTNDDPISGVKVDGCTFVIFGDENSGSPQSVRLDFTLSQGAGVSSKAEFQISVPFEVTVGTRAYTTN